MWYEAAPDEEFGDRFHENVSELFDQLLPNIPEVESGDFYFETPEFVDGSVFVDVASNGGDDETFAIEIVAK